MPDFKFANARNARRYTKAMDYPATAKVALMEMHKQVGVLKMDEHGIARRGVLVRHLVMPDDVAETGTVMRFLAERISKDTYVNIMGQYRPAGKVSSERVAEINRPVTGEEMKFAYQVANEAGLWRFDKRYI
jgi:putative pyruvate formate lyase activating enzyme